jgi:hypothetical protein
MPSDEEILNYIYAKQLEIENLKKSKLKNIDKRRFKFEKLKEHVDNFIDSDDEYYSRLIVMPGLRGIGKTILLYQLHDYLLNEKSINRNNIFYLDVNDLMLAYNSNIKEVIDTFIEQIHHTTISALDHKIFLLIDEAHLDDDWASYSRLLFDKSNNIFIILTGSSALKLNQNTDATRRITIEELLPCNFREYILLNYGINLKTDFLRQMIIKADKKSIEKSIECEKEIHEMTLQMGNALDLELKRYIYTKSYPFALNNDEFESYRYINNTIDRLYVMTCRTLNTSTVLQPLKYLS